MDLFASRRVSALALVLVALGAAAVACANDDDAGSAAPTPDAGTPDTGAPNSTDDAGTDDAGDTSALPCTNDLAYAPGDEDKLQDAVNSLTTCANITLAAGTYTFTNAITIRHDGITFKGAGKGAKGEATGGANSTVLVFTGAAANSNGVDIVGNNLSVSDFAIWNAQKDSLRIENSKNVKIQRVRAEWATENAASNGAYGIYPVSSENVLVEECEAYNASDAGIYVGQTKHSVIHKNVAKQNVAGIEIENCLYADVYENTAEDNTGGLVVFDLPGNPTAGTDISVHGNMVLNNNRANFAGTGPSSSTVSNIPAGTGTFIMASRRVELTGNTWTNNNTTDVAIVSGLSLEQDISLWTAGNFTTKDVYIHDNTFVPDSGKHVDDDAPDATNRPLGALVAGLYAYGFSQGIKRVEPVIWDGVDLTAQDNLKNDINLCVMTNTYPDGTDFAVADLNFVAAQSLIASDAAGAWAKGARYAADAAPFNCTGFTPALAPVVLP